MSPDNMSLIQFLTVILPKIWYIISISYLVIGGLFIYLFESDHVYLSAIRKIKFTDVTYISLCIIIWPLYLYASLRR